MTKHRPALDALRDSERLRLLLDQMPGILWTVDRDLVFTSSVGAALPAIGLEPDQVVGVSLFDYFRTDDPEAIPIAMHRKALRGEECSFEFSWEQRTFECHVEPFRNTDGTIAGAIGVAFDMTHSKLAEEALRHSESKYRTLFEESRDAIYVSASDGTLIEFNQSMISLFGYTREEMQRIDARALYADPADRKRFQEAIGREGSVKDYEVKLVRKGGEAMDCLLSSTAFHDIAGRMIGYQGIIRDITHRKQAQEVLRKEKEFSDAAIESLPGLFYLFDGQGRFLRWNRNLERVTGYTADEIRGMQPADFFRGEDRRTILEAIENVFERGQYTVEADLASKDGRHTPYFFTGTLVQLDSRDCVVGTAIDLVERRRLEQQLRQSQKMEAVGQLAGGLAHDFNNVLTVILANSEHLLGELSPRDPRREELEDIRVAAQRAASLTRQLLAFSRKQVLQPQVLNLNEVVSSIRKMLRRLIGEDIELLTMLERRLWAVEADPGQIEQIIMNLAVNARDAMPAGGKLTIQTGNVDVDVTFAHTHYPIVPGRYVKLAISDTGVGMDAETRSRIFEPFFTTKQVGKGTGLGLSTVYGIVKQSGGFIWAYSEPGLGTTFKIYFPRVEAQVTSCQIAETMPAQPQSSGTILLVEDETSVRALARRILEDGGYRVLEASGATDAIGLGERLAGEIDLLLTDVVMPEVSGPELAQQLTALQPRTRVLYTSGYTDHAVLRHGVLESGAAFLQKPFSPDELLQKVREVLDGGRPRP